MGLNDLDAATLKTWEDSFVTAAREKVPELSESDARSHFNTIRDALGADLGGGTRYGQYTWDELRPRVDKVSDALAGIEKKLPQAVRDREKGRERLLWSDSNVGKVAAADPEIRQNMGIEGDKLFLEGTAMAKMYEQFEETGKKATGNKGFLGNNSWLAWSGLSKNFAKGAEGKVEMILPASIGYDSVAWNTELHEVNKNMKGSAGSGKVTDLVVHNLRPEVNQALQSHYKKINDKGAEIDEIDAKLQDLAKNPSPSSAAVQKALLAKKQALTQEKDDLIQKRDDFLKGKLKQGSAWQKKGYKDARVQVPPPTDAQKEQFKRFGKGTSPGQGSMSIARLTEIAAALRGSRRPSTPSEAKKRAAEGFVAAAARAALRKAAAKKKASSNSA
jgi:hypothetical protein